MKKLVAIAMVMIVSVGALADAADATNGNTKAKVCTLREWRPIKNNMTLAQIAKILDGKGRRTRMQTPPGSPNQFLQAKWSRAGKNRPNSCTLLFDRPGPNKPWRVYLKTWTGQDGETKVKVWPSLP